MQAGWQWSLWSFQSLGQCDCGGEVGKRSGGYIQVNQMTHHQRGLGTGAGPSQSINIGLFVVS